MPTSGALLTGPLVQTKLFAPRLRRSVVPRPRLTDRLSRVAGARLTLISAPAGFGKSTLLAEWLAAAAADNRSVAWLSLDESDSEAAPFWTYVIAALQTVAPGVGAGALPLLQSAQPPVETVLASVLNELGDSPDEIYLVLDDYHLVDGPAVQPGMAYLLEHLPPHVHLVVSTRADPALPLARLRARGELVEVRAADLRFTLDEASAYLSEVGGLDLAASDVAALEGRTEGWVAALQLAALSMRGRADVSGFIAGFAGDDRYIVDYLVEEVLERQPDPVRTFLVQTSILDRLTGSLCDAVTARAGGRAMLESVERANLFVVPLDDSRRWYRYHHLFADVLQSHLLTERPDEVADLHRRASRWYDEAGEPSPAVRHALAAGDVGRAAELVELAIPALARQRQEATIRGWLDVLPDEVVRVRPVLAVGLVGGQMSRGDFEGVEERLREAEQWLEKAAAGPAEGMVVVDEQGLARLPGTIQMYRAALALLRGDRPATLRHARLATERATEDDHLVRSGASALTGLARWGDGDLEAAHAAYSVAVEGLQRAGHIADVLGCSITLADIRLTQGRLDEALRTYEDALRLAAREAGPPLRGTPDMHVGLSQVALERGDVASAVGHLERSRALGEHLGLPQNAYRSRVAMARVREAQGDVDGALALLEEAERTYAGDFSPNVRPVSAVRARLLAAHGRVDEATAWVRARGLSAEDDVSYLHEYEHVTLARVLLAQHALDAAAGLLGRLLAPAEGGGRGGSVIEMLVLQALVRQARGDSTRALAALERALTLAEPQGYVRVFTGEGAAVTGLLKAAAKRRPGWAYVRRLLADCDQTPLTQARDTPGLVEPLSSRELDVLRLLGSDLDGPAIARELVVSLNTLRTHTKNIYAKLGVTSRREAVRRAAELGLLSRPRRP